MYIFFSSNHLETVLYAWKWHQLVGRQASIFSVISQRHEILSLPGWPYQAALGSHIQMPLLVLRLNLELSSRWPKLTLVGWQFPACSQYRITIYCLSGILAALERIEKSFAAPVFLWGEDSCWEERGGPDLTHLCLCKFRTVASTQDKDSYGCLPLLTAE